MKPKQIKMSMCIAASTKFPKATTIRAGLYGIRIVGKCLLGLRRQEAYERRLHAKYFVHTLANQSVAVAKFE